MKLAKKKFRKNSFLKWHKFFYFLVPAIFLSVAVITLFILKFGSKHEQSSNQIPSPAKIINVNDHFSGELYFNNEFGKTEISNVIISEINKAKKSVELAVYSINHKLIRQALYQAAQRGVKVKLILSSKQKDAHDKFFSSLPKNIERLDVKSSGGDTNLDGLMHDKFLIIDRGEQSASLIFGSYNFTELQEKYDPSLIMQTTRPEIIDIFGNEFDRLCHKNDKQQQIFHPFAALINYPEGYLEIWFAPQPNRGGLRERLLGIINNSNDISVLIWNLTDKLVARSLADRAINGKRVRILTDDINFFEKDSAFLDLTKDPKLKSLNNLEIITDYKRNQEIKNNFKESFNSFLHFHVLLADNNLALFGTNNWSRAGFYINDESAIVTNIPEIFKALKNTFEINYQKNK